MRCLSTLGHEDAEVDGIGYAIVGLHVQSSTLASYYIRAVTVSPRTYMAHPCPFPVAFLGATVAYFASIVALSMNIVFEARLSELLSSFK